MLAYLEDVKDVLCLTERPLTTYSSTASPSLVGVICWLHCGFWLGAMYALCVRQQPDLVRTAMYLHNIKCVSISQSLDDV